MLKKKQVSVLLMFLMTMIIIGSLFADTKNSGDYSNIIGEYELHYPLGTKNIFFFSYYLKDGALFCLQKGAPDEEGLISIGSDPLLFKGVKTGEIHKFLRNDSGNIDRIIIKVKKLEVKGIKLPTKIYKKNNQPKIGEKYSIKAMKDDFDQMVRIIKFLHPAMYDYTSKEEFEKFIKESRAKIVKPMKINEFFEIAAPVIAKIGCLHSSLRPPMFYKAFKEARFFPMEVHLIKDKLYIIESFNKTYSYLKGSEVISINGEPINNIKKRIFNFLSSDWHNTQYKKSAFSVSFYIYYYYLYGSVDNFQIEYEFKNKIETKEIKGLLKSKINEAYKRYPEHPIYSSEDYSLNFTKDNKIALLNIDHFIYYQKEQIEKFYKFIDQSFLEIKNKKTQNLLIDIRGNIGGSPFATFHLLSYLIDKPFQYFNKIHSKSYKPLFELKKPHKNLFTGKVITLVDASCLSTSGHFISLFKYHKIGKLAGTITGSNFSCTHGESRFALRNTKMLIRMSKERFTTPVKGHKIDEGIIPDIKIDLTLEDLLDKRDIQLEKALELFSIKKK